MTTMLTEEDLAKTDQPRRYMQLKLIQQPQGTFFYSIIHTNIQQCPFSSTNKVKAVGGPFYTLVPDGHPRRDAIHEARSKMKAWALALDVDVYWPYEEEIPWKTRDEVQAEVQDQEAEACPHGEAIGSCTIVGCTGGIITMDVLEKLSLAFQASQVAEQMKKRRRP